METKQQDCGIMTCIGCIFIEICYKNEEEKTKTKHKQ